jgi:hypothetical protein
MNPDYEKARRLFRPTPLMIANCQYDDIIVFEPPHHGNSIDAVHVFSPSGVEKQWNVRSPEAHYYTAVETMEDILDVLDRWLEYIEYLQIELSKEFVPEDDSQGERNY